MYGGLSSHFFLSQRIFCVLHYQQSVLNLRTNVHPVLEREDKGIWPRDFEEKLRLQN